MTSKTKMIELCLKVWNREGFNGSIEQQNLGLKYFPQGFSKNFNDCILFILSNESLVWWNGLKNYYLQGELSKKYFNSEVGMNYNMLVNNEITYIYLMEEINKLDIIKPEPIVKKSEDVYYGFSNFCDGVFDYVEPLSNVNTFQMGVTKINFNQKENILYVHLRKPGLLIGKGGENINKLIAYLGCDVHIVEVKKLWD